MEVKWLAALFGWRIVKKVGVWACWENRITKDRHISRWTSDGHSPYPEEWLLEPGEA